MSRLHLIRFSSLALLGLIVLVTRGANASPIVYGTFPGATIDYVGVQEESSSDPGSGFFGGPTVAGDAMDFNPQAFAASSSGLNSDLTDSNLQFMVKAHANKGINAISFAEAGDTTLTGLAGQAQTTAGTIINAEVQELNIAGVLTPVSINLPQIVMPFAPKGSFLLTVDGAGTKGWTGDVVLDLSAFGGQVTKVGISLDNTLTAASVAGTSAFIQKKDADALVISVSTGGRIPEPSSAVMAMIAAVLGGAFVRRRK
jgi:PEP-CTERM motif